MRDYVNSAALQEYTTKLVAKLKTLFPGTPTAVATVAEMTDHNKTYVYVGTETGYTAGDWYYWDGSAWTSGGPFQATSIITDTTLAVAGEAADAKATGDAISAAKAAGRRLRQRVRASIRAIMRFILSSPFLDGVSIAQSMKSPQEREKQRL